MDRHRPILYDRALDVALILTPATPLSSWSPTLGDCIESPKYFSSPHPSLHLPSPGRLEQLSVSKFNPFLLVTREAF